MVSGSTTCACGHTRDEHSDPTPHHPPVCVHKFDDPDAGWYGVCPCCKFRDVEDSDDDE